MSDIFQEVDEEVRREQLKKLWERYGVLIIGFALLLVLGVAGWRGYEWWQARRSAEAAVAYEAALMLSQQGKHAEAEAAFAKIAAGAPPGYRMLARLREAAEISQRDAKAAVAIYDAVAADGSVPQPIRDLAAVRSGMLLVDTQPYSEVSRRLEPLAASDRPFRHTAREMLALSAWRIPLAAKRAITWR